MSGDENIEEYWQDRLHICMGARGHKRCEHYLTPLKCDAQNNLLDTVRTPEASCPFGKWKDTKIPPMAKRVLKGIAGITKATLHIDRASPAVIQKRQSICKTCPKLKRSGRCEVCGCFISLKTTIASERCPEGRWFPESSGTIIRPRSCKGCNG